MFIVLMGAPGAGKGTQAEKLAKGFALSHVSCGEIFRNIVKEGTEIGNKAKEYIYKGKLVPDEVVISLVKDYLAKHGSSNGVLLDGFPRTVEQAQALDEILDELQLKIYAVVNIDVLEEELTDRLTGRRVCRNCGASYHLKFNPPKVRNICDHCSGELYQRSDDNVDAVKERLSVYCKQTMPIIDYYKQKDLYYSVDGSRPINDVFTDIADLLKKIVN